MYEEDDEELEQELTYDEPEEQEEEEQDSTAGLELHEGECRELNTDLMNHSIDNADTDVVNHLMQEDTSVIPFTSHTALGCNLCGCTCYRPVKSGDNSPSGLCECGRTCAQHKWG